MRGESEGRKRFFFGKKNQKTFGTLRLGFPEEKGQHLPTTSVRRGFSFLTFGHKPRGVARKPEAPPGPTTSRGYGCTALISSDG
jgi:hypothetical protein